MSEVDDTNIAVETWRKDIPAATNVSDHNIEFYTMIHCQVVWDVFQNL